MTTKEEILAQLAAGTLDVQEASRLLAELTNRNEAPSTAK
jgi:hypothetical protein